MSVHSKFCENYEKNNTYVRGDLLQQWLQYGGALPSDVGSDADNTVKKSTTQLPVILHRYQHQVKYYHIIHCVLK